MHKIDLPGQYANEWIYSLYDDNGKIWIGTSSGLLCYEKGNIYPILPEIKNTVNDILKDLYGNMWIGTTDGLFRKNKSDESLEYISTDNGLKNNFVVDFLFDFEGNFWVTQYKGGLTRISDGKFTNYTYSGGLPGKVVNAINEISPSVLLIGFDNGSMAKIDKGQIVPFHTKTDLLSDRIRHIMTDSRQNLWISTYNGLLKVSPSGQETILNKKTGFPESRIRLTYEDSKGNIWVGTRNEGVIKIEPSSNYTIFNVANRLSSNLIMDIEEDAYGNIWVGTSEGSTGLNMITPRNEIFQYTREKGFICEIVFNIYCDKGGLVWIASNNGLWLINGEQLHCFNSKRGLIDDSPYDVLEDDYGFLWLPYSEGIMKISKKELLLLSENKTDKISVNRYDKHDGMKQSECNPTTQAIKGSNGKLYFPTLDGIAMIDPLNMMYNNYIPPVYIEKLKTDNQFADLQAKPVFSPSFKRYTFSFSAPCLYDAEKVKFRYRLKGFENEWNETDNVRTVSYTNLKHGNYIFEVTASNNDNIWNEKGTAYSFTVKPRFVDTAIFYLIVFLAFFLSGYLFYRIRVKQLQKQKIELEKLITERTYELLEKNNELKRQKNIVEQKTTILEQQKYEIEKQTNVLEQQKEELKELVASKDKIFSIISHDLRAPLGNIKNMIDLLTEHPDRFDEEKRSKIFKTFAVITQSTFYLVDNLLNWSKSQRGLVVPDPETFLVIPVIEETMTLLNPIYEKKKIKFENQIDPSTIVYADINMARTIFRNLLNNALKFTPENGNISIFQTIKGEMIEFSIKDNGMGMSEENLKSFAENKEMLTTPGTNNERGSGLGLLICRDFITKNGGDFHIESNEEKGTTVSFTLNRFQV